MSPSRTGTKKRNDRICCRPYAIPISALPPSRLATRLKGYRGMASFCDRALAHAALAGLTNAKAVDATNHSRTRETPNLGALSQRMSSAPSEPQRRRSESEEQQGGTRFRHGAGRGFEVVLRECAYHSAVERAVQILADWV